MLVCILIPIYTHGLDVKMKREQGSIGTYFIQTI